MTRRRTQNEMPRLFQPEQLRVRLGTHQRLLALAGRPPRTATERELRSEEDQRTIGRLRAWGSALAERFELGPHVLEAEQAGVVGHYGICYEDGLIRIRLRHARTGRLLKESSLVDTLCHELAHLRHLDHSPRFKRLYLKILETARDLGYYRPGPGEHPRPRQLQLFESGSCGIASSDRTTRTRHETAV